MSLSMFADPFMEESRRAANVLLVERIAPDAIYTVFDEADALPLNKTSSNGTALMLRGLLL